MTEGVITTSVTARGIAVYPAGATYGPRYLWDYELVWMMEGDAVYEWEDERLNAPEGSILLCRPGVTDRFVWDKRRRTRHGFCHFSIASLSPGFPPESDWPHLLGPGAAPVLDPVFRYLLSWGEGENTAAVESALRLLVIAFIAGPTQHSPVRNRPQAVIRVLAYIARRLDEESDARITLREMADVACCTKEHLCRVFRKYTNLSPAESVRIMRLEHTATMLTRSNYSISEVSSIFGFSNPSHFTKCFTDEYTVSPTEFRRNVRSGAQPPRSRIER